MPYPIVKLKQQRSDRLLHPWVFDNEVAAGPEPASAFSDGDIVRVIDARGKATGVGYFNSRSKIAVRYVSRNPEAVIDDRFWRELVGKAASYRKLRYAAGGLPPAYRLSHGEADGLPGLVVDVYGDYAVVQFLALGVERVRNAIVAGIRDSTGIRNIYERSDSSVRRLEGLEERTGVIAGQPPPDILAVDEGDVVALVDIKNGGKTGLFLDQRENQRAAAREASGRDVLNCFSYTGLFGLRAARNGAKRVIDIESSASFNALNEVQWERNKPGADHTILADNVFDYLRAREKARDRHDMIVLDPPAFTKNRGSREGAARGYNEINRMAFRMLRPGGILVTCSCSHHITADEFRGIMEKAAGDAGRSGRIIAQLGQPVDHPVLMHAPESEYLKCLIVAVD